MGRKGKGKEKTAKKKRREGRKTPKTVILPNFKFRGSCTHPPSPIWAKFGLRVGAHGILFQGKVHRDQCILLYHI